MVVRLVTHGDVLLLKLSPALLVDLDALVRRVGDCVIPEYLPHVVEHSDNRRACRRQAFPLIRLLLCLVTAKVRTRSSSISYSIKRINEEIARASELQRKQREKTKRTS